MTDVYTNIFKKSITIKSIAKTLFCIYLITLFIFVDNPNLIIISQIIFILFAIFSSVYIIINNKLSLGAYFWLIGTFLLLCASSIFWALDTNISLSKAFTLFQLFIMTILIYNLFDKEEIEIFPLSIVIAGFTLALYTLYIYGFNNIIDAIYSGQRLGSEISQENIFGIYSALTVVACLYYAINKNKKIFYLLLMLPLLLVLSSGSRKAILIIPLGLILFLLFKYGLKTRFIVYFIIIIILMIILIQIPLFKFVMERLFSMFNLFFGEEIDSSTLNRQKMIIFGLKEFSKRPILGYGIDNFRVLYGGAYASGTYAHNNFVELLVDVGLVGFFIYYSIYTYLFVKLISKSINKNSISIFLLIILCIMFIMDIGAVSYYSKIMYIIFCFCFISLKKNRTSQLIKSIANPINNK